MHTADDDDNAVRTTEVPTGGRAQRPPPTHERASEDDMLRLAVAAKRSVFLIIAWPDNCGHSILAEFTPEGGISRNEPGPMAPTVPRVYIAMDVEHLALDVDITSGLDPATPTGEKAV